jgi:hypothetical protein
MPDINQEIILAKLDKLAPAVTILTCIMEVYSFNRCVSVTPSPHCCLSCFSFGFYHPMLCNYKIRTALLNI